AITNTTDNKGLLNFKNNTGETITLTRIIVDDGELNDYNNKQIYSGNNEIIQLTHTCECGPNQKTKTCEFQITYKTKYGLEKKIKQSIIVNCEENPEPEKPPITPTPTDCSLLEIIEVCGMDGNTYQNTCHATQAGTDINYIGECETAPTEIEDCIIFETNPIPICTLSDLNRIREKLDGNYILQNDIDASNTSIWNNGEGWEPIGNSTNKFKGSLNGNNNKIKNLYINRFDQNYVGLIGNLYLGTVSYLGLLDYNITGNNYVGGISGYLRSGQINNSYTTGKLSGIGEHVGGLIGYFMSGQIIDSYNTANISGGYNHVGGITGYSYEPTLTQNVYNTGDINGNWYVGGVSGELKKGIFFNVHNTGDVNGQSSTGGVIGYTYDGTITNTYNTGIVTGKNQTGGINGGANIGTPGTIINNSYNTGNITGLDEVGGITGWCMSQKINNVYNLGNVNGTTRVGGIVGQAENGVINNVYNIGSITATSTLGTGGLIGRSYTNLNNSFNVGTVNATEGFFGGIEGFMNYTVTNTNVYWDTVLSSQNNCYSGGSNGCFSTTTGDPSYYYFSTNAPLSSWTWGVGGNWIAQDNNFPILSWQNN
ncbi:MAG: hypothetical protein PHX27_04135, partial [Candidatus ainarchaeum sp.]|nr:hypothetical protein [Candidatus ainarchaeum sp.]